MMPKKPTIGFLAAGLDEPYQIRIHEGALAHLSKVGARLISFPGIPSSTGYAGTVRSPLTHELATPERIDGLIILSSTYGGYLDPRQLEAFFDGFSPLPIVSVGLKLEGFASIRIDNATGMRALMDHLLDEHGYRKPAFVGGPLGHPEAEVREAVFREALAARGIEVDERLVAHSGFFAEGAERSMRQILAAGAEFDLVVCATDSMALVAESILDEVGLSVPSRCGLSGFDDIPSSSRTPFSLTTVHQPLREMGMRGAEMILSVLEGGKPSDVSLESSLVVRASCGCKRRHAAPQVDAEPETVRQQKEAKRARVLRMLGVRLLGAQGVEEVRTILDECLGDLEAGAVMASVIAEEDRAKREKRARLFYSSLPEGKAFCERAELYPISRIFPEGYPVPSGSSLICPLNFGEEIIGFMVFDELPGTVEVYYTMSLQIANAIKVTELEAKRREHMEDLARLVEERTKELREEEARRRLAEQEILAISEREQRRIGQDLHDDICQRLAGISILVGVLGLGKASEEGASAAMRISDELREVIKRTKSLSRGLFPVILEKQGIEGALEELAMLMDGQAGVSCKYRQSGRKGAFPCPPEASLHLYRIAQEASSNAVRHSCGKEVSIELDEGPDSLKLSIIDDGKGFPKSQECGMGLSTMRYRACLINAELSIMSSKRGTSVICSLETDAYRKGAK
jgi:signal transduction histidine kinase/DNA-binding LacI/PurR family transcriptional regulator